MRTGFLSHAGKLVHWGFLIFIGKLFAIGFLAIVDSLQFPGLLGSGGKRGELEFISKLQLPRKNVILESYSSVPLETEL